MFPPLEVRCGVFASTAAVLLTVLWYLAVDSLEALYFGLLRSALGIHLIQFFLALYVLNSYTNAVVYLCFLNGCILIPLTLKLYEYLNFKKRISALNALTSYATLLLFALYSVQYQLKLDRRNELSGAETTVELAFLRPTALALGYANANIATASLVLRLYTTVDKLITYKHRNDDRYYHEDFKNKVVMDYRLKQHKFDKQVNSFAKELALLRRSLTIKQIENSEALINATVMRKNFDERLDQ